MKETTHLHINEIFSTPWDWSLWRLWIFANAIGEALGLGIVAFAGIWFASNMAGDQSAFSIIAAAIAMILMGTFEGVVVGFAQSLVMRRAIEGFSSRAWIFATAIGAFIAWALGGLPGVYMSLNEQAGGVPPTEMGDMAMYGMAAVMGLGLGFTLGVPQWLILKRYLNKAWWWMPANALAWACGMPLVFIAAGNEPPSNLIILAAWILFVIAVIGAVVGAVHGLFLVWLLKGRAKAIRAAKGGNNE